MFVPLVKIPISLQKDAVIAITSDVDDMQLQLNLVWKHLLPALK
ncbi:hypothetical protein Barb6_00364 [Bacteroidales bacterium Barb6]|nr:hypothetical protein Barb6_00364 [Bacteroidales bacterium Barb6]